MCHSLHSQTGKRTILKLATFYKNRKLHLRKQIQMKDIPEGMKQSEKPFTKCIPDLDCFYSGPIFLGHLINSFHLELNFFSKRMRFKSPRGCGASRDKLPSRIFFGLPVTMRRSRRRFDNSEQKLEKFSSKRVAVSLVRTINFIKGQGQTCFNYHHPRRK